MSNETNVQGEEKMSPEEIKKRRAEITKYYKEQIVHLKVQCEYEKLLLNLKNLELKDYKRRLLLLKHMKL